VSSDKIPRELKEAVHECALQLSISAGNAAQIKREFYARMKDQFGEEGAALALSILTIGIERTTTNIHVEVNMKPPAKKQNPWVGGSFYLVVGLSVMIVLGWMGQVVSPWAIPAVILGGLLLVTIISLFTALQSEAIGERTFNKVMILTFQQIPLLGRLIERKEKPEDRSEQEGTGPPSQGSPPAP
jgi:hypothetical protein